MSHKKDTWFKLDNCHLLIIFANRSDLDQVRQNVGPDLGPNYLHSDGIVASDPVYTVCLGPQKE